MTGDCKGAFGMTVQIMVPQTPGHFDNSMSIGRRQSRYRNNLSRLLIVCQLSIADWILYNVPYFALFYSAIVIGSRITGLWNVISVYIEIPNICNLAFEVIKNYAREKSQ